MNAVLLDLKVTDRQQTIYQAKGCASCDNQGYKGRMSLIEILSFDSDMDELVARRGTTRELMRMALSKGFGLWLMPGQNVCWTVRQVWMKSLVSLT